MIINIIEDNIQKSIITEKILKSLKPWFGIEQSIVEYIEGVKDQLFLAVYDELDPIGFICISYNNAYTAEIYVMGILEKYHRTGIGSRLIQTAEGLLRKDTYKFLMVKTLGPSHEDVNYQKTRIFYTNMGFYPLAEFKEIWDEHNPCLILIKNI